MVRGTAPAFSEDQFYELRLRLDRMSDEELAEFRSAPEHAAMLRLFEEFAFRQMRPYLAAFILFLVASVTVGSLLVR